MTLPSRHRIRNSSPGGLRPSTLPFGHGGSPQYWLSHVDGEETFFISFKPPRPGTEPRSLKPMEDFFLTAHNPANTRRCPNVGLMFDHCLRSWPNISARLGQCLVFVGIYLSEGVDMPSEGVMTFDVLFELHVGLMFAYRLRRCPNMSPTLG